MTESAEPESEFWSEFLTSASKLARITRRVRLLGQLAMLATVLVAVVSLVVIAMRPQLFASSPYSQSRYFSDVEVTLISLIPCAIVVFALAVLLTLEHMLRYGDALFEELTEELQYRISLPDIQDPSRLRAPALGRLAMKDYSHARALPFLPARSGPAILLVVNVVFAALPPIVVAF